MIDKFRTRIWVYYGHFHRMGEERLQKQVMFWPSDGSRRRDRPNDTLRRTIKQDASTRGFLAGNVEHVARSTEH